MPALVAALSRPTIAGVDVCDSAAAAVENDWPEGLAAIAAAAPEALRGYPAWLSRAMARATASPVLFAALLDCPLPTGSGSPLFLRFFCNEGHAVAFAAALCTSPSSATLHATLTARSQEAAADLRGILSTGRTRTSFLKGLAARWRIAGGLSDGNLDFMAHALDWSHGTVAAMAATLLKAKVPFGLDRWQAFLDRHPPLAKIYLRELQSAKPRASLLQAVERNVPKACVMAWLRDMASRLPAPPQARADGKALSDMESVLAATWVSLRLATPPAPSRSARRLA